MTGITYKIERKDTYFSDYFYSLGTTSENNYTDSGIKIGHSYLYRISTHSYDYGETEMSESTVLSTPISAPVIVNIEQDDDSSIRISWEYDNPSDVKSPIKYQLYRATESPENDSSYYPLWDDFESTESSYFYSYTHFNSIDYLTYKDFDIEPDTSYYYKAKAQIFDDQSSLSTTYKSMEASGGSGSWIALGSSDFGFAVDEVKMSTANGIIYALFADNRYPEKRLKVMSHSGESDIGDWADAGEYLSLGAVESDEGCIYSDGTNLYSAYIEAEDNQLFVKKYDDSSWNSVGSNNGVSVENFPPLTGYSNLFGHNMDLKMVGSELFMVYQTDSFGLNDTITYTGNDEYWIEDDTGFWGDMENIISASDIRLDTDSDGNLIAALRSDTTVDFYKYQAETWTKPATITPSVEAVYMEDMCGFLVDEHGDYYLGYVTRDSYGYQDSAGIQMWNGTTWNDIELLSQQDTASYIDDMDIVKRPSGLGLIVSVAWRTTEGEHWIEVLEYNGSTWLQIGPDIETSIEAIDSLNIGLTLDSSDRPFIVYSDSSTGSMNAFGFRE